MVEIQWGAPITLYPTHNGVAERFSTIEKARHWLRRNWPIVDDTRQAALEKIESAIDCMSPVKDARSAFVAAALSAGFVPDCAS
ncbi:DUF982 domain-containing protein [Arenibacterium halophilum]|uniref:DUF982 domain-containing protein n=1 Tax=Arenibacterium halophilum TaxID=2583821 RepID=A0ABY2XCU9_9RHOB|nr:DUF982 domain-containing protein [Arenibacterium halophilum]TMV13684.1 DUF982 domain-containing protein [Arenibacterium halophilum]